jgi:hypothetical protein
MTRGTEIADKARSSERFHSFIERRVSTRLLQAHDTLTGGPNPISRRFFHPTHPPSSSGVVSTHRYTCRIRACSIGQKMGYRKMTGLTVFDSRSFAFISGFENGA